MNRLMIRLWGIIEEESPDSINYMIAKVLISNISKIRSSSSAELAKFCNVSKPSISRFVKIIGYDDYYDFRSDISQFSPDKGTKFAWSEDEQVNWIDSFFAEVSENIETMNNDLFKKQINKLVEDIVSYDSINLFGNMQSGSSASNLHLNLHTYKPKLVSSSGFKEQTAYLRNMKDYTLNIIFSVSGEYFRVLFENGEVLNHTSKSKVWLVTTNPLIKKMNGVDEILNCNTGDEISGSNTSIEFVSSLLALGYWRTLQQ